ncbi:MAG: SDR family NAD(P)-dependent oxidoreductase [Gammaproteobacteria bacterium]|jgi:NAD(P)-dependent dehydrogenase (short-subunit alcohol dehydrogenase family)
MKKSVAIVGGAGPTLGLALCDALTESGYQVVALSRTNEGGQKTKSSQVKFMPCDLTDEGQVFATIREIEENVGHIETYIHNLGGIARARFLESDARQFEQLWKLNCLSAYHASKAVIAEMIDNSGGNIVFVGATASLKGNAEFSAFAAAKFALRGLAQSLAREFGPEGIHVAHVVIDGVMWSERAQGWGMKPEQCLQPKSVANTICHVVQQDRSAWTHELDIRPDVERF